MKRPGFEADRFGVILYDGSTSREIDPNWDRSADKIAFSGDDKSLYVLATDDGRNRLFQMDVKTGAVKLLTGDAGINDFDVAHTSAGDVIVYAHDAMNAPSQLYALRPGHAPVQLTHADDATLKDVQFSPYERFSFAGWSGDKVSGWITKPYGWQAGKTYPVVMMIHGGPQGSWEDSFSYRWNPQVWAGWGYAATARPSPTPSPATGATGRWRICRRVGRRPWLRTPGSTARAPAPPAPPTAAS
jgi:dipeptidyl aminopeptidase/acylaminoacyl peptidase